MNSESHLHELDLTEQEGALAAAVLEIVRHASGSEHDIASSPGRFALFATQQLIASRPELAALLPAATHDQAADDAYHLTSIELGTQHAELGAELLECTWPEDLSGGLVYGLVHGSSERLPHHDQPEPLFVAVGALMDGETFCAVRPSATDPLKVGRALVPELITALQASIGLSVL